jgi:hypothetical protein
MRFAAQLKVGLGAPFSKQHSAPASRSGWPVACLIRCRRKMARSHRQSFACRFAHGRRQDLLRRDVANAAESLTYARTEQAVSGEGGPPRAIAVGLLSPGMACTPKMQDAIFGGCAKIQRPEKRRPAAENAGAIFRPTP